MVGHTPKLVLPKPRLCVAGEYVQVSRDWADLHVYVLSPWLRTLLRERQSMLSIQGDGIPLFVSRQFRGMRQTFGSRVEESVVNEAMRVFEKGDLMSLALDTGPPGDEYAVRAHVLNGWKALRASTIPSYLYACKEVMTKALEDEGRNESLSISTPENKDK